MNQHKQFEILCALAVVGQVNDADLRELKQHIEGCDDCRSRISDFAQISAQALPLSGEKYSNRRSRKAMTVRFVQRARAEGIPLQEGQTLPSELLIWSLGGKRNVAAALLLITIVASGVSKFVHSRAQSADTAKAAQLELPSERSIQTKVTQDRSTPPRAKLSPIPRQMRMSNPRFVESVHTPRRPNTEQHNGSSRPELFPPSIQYSANQPQDRTALNSQLFSNGGDSEHPRFFRPYDTSSGGQRLIAPLPMAFTEHGPLMNAANHVGADPRKRMVTFAITPLNSPLHVFRYNADRPLLSISTPFRPDLQLNIDWYQVWLQMRSTSLPNSNDSFQYHPGVLVPEWPFSKDFKADQQ